MTVSGDPAAGHVLEAGFGPTSFWQTTDTQLLAGLLRYKQLQDPTFRLMGSERIWERGAALTSWVQSFETELLAQGENLSGLGQAGGKSLLARADGNAE